MRVGTPFGEYPVEFKRIERREGAIVIVAGMAGLESTVVLDREDLGKMIRKLAPIGVALVLIAYARTRG
jgi:hypothetical protein